MKIKTFSLGSFQTNCYLVIDEHTKECLIFDPGANGNDLIKYMEEERLQLKAVLLTHGHFDHIGGVQALLDFYHVPLYVHGEDEEMLSSTKYNLSSLVGDPVVVHTQANIIKEGDTIVCGSMKFTVITTPGHTPGGVCYYGEDVLIAGDTLFNRSVGRTDFPRGNYDDLISNIKNKLYKLPTHTVVYPGHGPITTIGEEIAKNPFTN